MTHEFEIRKEVELPATPEQVWEAVTTREGTSSWLFPTETAPRGGNVPGLTAWDPPKRFVVRTPAGAAGTFQSFEYVVEARDGGTTVLTFVQSGILGDDWEGEYQGTSAGWDMYFHTLREYLTHFAGRTATYVLADGGEKSIGEHVWPVLLRGLGLEDVAEGDAMSLALSGLPPVEGFADYVRPGAYLGIRTTDALYRFHIRTAMGMPVAAGHHLFGKAEGAGIAWTTWLTALYT